MSFNSLISGIKLFNSHCKYKKIFLFLSCLLVQYTHILLVPILDSVLWLHGGEIKAGDLADA